VCNAKSDEDEANITQGVFIQLKTRRPSCEEACETQTIPDNWRVLKEEFKQGDDDKIKNNCDDNQWPWKQEQRNTSDGDPKIVPM